jgi:bifunctional UDP-N-acetylglucosamine pyrophosphorylase/glucosamine-1-phosphate N-acetyltransferase
MAAGKGTRLNSRRAKVLHEIGGKPLLGHVIAAAEKIVAPGNIFAVVGHQAKAVESALKHTGINFVLQAEQRGTGHAVQSAAPAIAGYENFLVLSGDVPLIRPESIREVWDYHSAQHAAMTLLSAVFDEPTNYGRVIRNSPDSPEVTAIVEQKMLAPDQLAIKEINMGMYAFRTAPMLGHLGKLTTDNPHGELYLTDMARVLSSAGERVVAIQTGNPAELLGANTIAELVALDATLRASVANRLMAQGVTIFRPETCTIDPEVEVGPDTVIEPFVQLLGRTKIGSDCRIRSYSVIENCTLADSVLILPSCVLADSTIDRGASIGPFARMRPGCEIGEDVHIGNFVETKKARLHKGVKVGHLTYLGDAEIGAKTNIGAGTITCNYDGEKKHRTTIGDNVFVGSDSTLIAPVTIESDSYIGAGSCITRTVPSDSLAIGRARQVVIDGWVTARRAKRAKKTE